MPENINDPERPHDIPKILKSESDADDTQSSDHQVKFIYINPFVWL